MVSLEWSFEKDFSGVVRNQNVKLSREQIEQDFYLICQSAQNRSTPGAKIIDIVLPNNGKEFCLEVEGFANNNKAFLWVLDEAKRRLITEYVTLPELIASSQKVQPTRATFKLHSSISNESKDYIKISVGVLFGGSQPSTNDIFFLKKVRLYEAGGNTSVSGNKATGHNSGVQITRVYQNINELELDLPNPVRDNGTKMYDGEYALIKQDGSSDHGKLFVVYGDPDLNSAKNLKYVCNITAHDNILTKSLFLEDDQVIPIYDDQWKAYEDVKNKNSAKDFYNPDSKKTQRVDGVSKKDGKVFLYFDKAGYIRWMNSRKMKKNENEEEVSISVSQPLVERLKKLGNLSELPETKIIPSKGFETASSMASTIESIVNVPVPIHIPSPIQVQQTSVTIVQSEKEPEKIGLSHDGDGTLSQDEDDFTVKNRNIQTCIGNLTKSTDATLDFSHFGLDKTLVSEAASATYRTKAQKYILGGLK